MSRDLNQHGNLFGGIILAWLDEAGCIYVMDRISYSNIVTVRMDNISFKGPGRNGDVLRIYAGIEKFGRTSVKTKITAISISQHTHIEKEIITCSVTYVCLDEAGEPFPYFEINQMKL